MACGPGSLPISPLVELCGHLASHKSVIDPGVELKYSLGTCLDHTSAGGDHESTQCLTQP